MPNIASSLGTTQPYIPAINPNHVGRFSGLAMIFADVAAMGAAMAASAADIWPDGQVIFVAPEFIGGMCCRVWKSSLAHARTAMLRPGLEVVLAGNDNVLLFGSGAPGAGVGANGDVYIDWGGNTYYTKAAGAWTSTGSLYSGGLPSPLVLENPDTSGSLVKFGLTSENPTNETTLIYVSPTFVTDTYDEKNIAGITAESFGGNSQQAAVFARSKNDDGTNFTAASLTVNATGAALSLSSYGAGSSTPKGIFNATQYAYQTTLDASNGSALTIRTSAIAGIGSGSLDIRTGNTAGSDPSGNITFATGTSPTGTRGSITFSGVVAVAPVALTDAATINTDGRASNDFTVTLGGNRTLANPSNMVHGANYTWRVRQDGTGSRTLAYGSKFKWPNGTVPVLTTAAGATDLIVGKYYSDTDTLLCVLQPAFG